MSMTAEDRASIIADLMKALQERDKLLEDVKTVIAAEVPKAVAEAMKEVPKAVAEAMKKQINLPFVTSLDLGAGAPGPGDLPPDLPEGGPRPVSYIVGAPPAVPVLRALKQPICDTLIIPEEGLLVYVDLFSDRKWFPDHKPKTPHDCNMTNDGFLGYPLEYDLRALDLVFEKWSHPDDVVRVRKGLLLQWFFGQNTAWLRLEASAWKPLIVLPHEVEDARAHIERLIVQYAETGVWPSWRHEMTTPDGKPRRVSSTEVFHCKADLNVGELHGPVRVKMLMQDTLFAQV